ncbi:hypothetical protein GYH30_009781 [Glycine max]|nr:hypothetical protein JHK86_009938 [Glycine max]KAH1111153.1 hypothetical protein GYH30_009781 [Glycine max]
MGASLGYQYGCWNGLKYLNHTSLVVETVSFLDSLTILSRNALSMKVSYDLLGNNTALWRLSVTEPDGFKELSTEGLGVGSQYVMVAAAQRWCLGR